MLASPYRLKKDEEFSAVKEKGKLTQGKLFAVSVLKREDEEPSRFGIVVSTKISKNASERNRIKRAVSEAIRQNIVYIKPGYDCVLLAKQSANRSYVRDLMDETFNLLKKAKLIKQ